MRKATMTNRFGGGWLLAASLAFTLAAFGCSSNQMYGNGQPTTVTPTINSSDHAVTPGSSGGTNGNPPMTSSYTYPSSSSMYPTNQVDVDALALAAAQRAYRGVVLGPSGAQGYQPAATIAGGVYVSPALSVNPAQTINSSISSSGGGQAITGGPIVPAAQGGVSLTPTGTALAASTVATTGGTTATTGALTTSTGTPVLGGSAMFSPVLMNSTPAPQATGTANPTLATIGATATTAVPIVGGSLLPGVTTTNTAATTATPAAAASTLRTSASMTATVVNGIQIQTGANGGITVTNVGTTGAAAAHH